MTDDCVEVWSEMACLWGTALAARIWTSPHSHSYAEIVSIVAQECNALAVIMLTAGDETAQCQPDEDDAEAGAVALIKAFILEMASLEAEDSSVPH